MAGAASRAIPPPSSGLLDAGAWFAPEFAGERMPTLAEAVAVLLELGLNANVEIKPASGHEVATGEAVADALQRLWPRARAAPAAIELRARSLAAARRVAPDLARACSSARCRTIGRWHWKVWPARPCILTRAEPLPIPCACWPRRACRRCSTPSTTLPGRASCWPPAPWPCSPICRMCCSPASPLSSDASARPVGPGS